MNIKLSPFSPCGNTRAIASKSVAHRALICAAFSDSGTKIRCEETNADIEATARCLSALGAKIEYSKPYFSVTPITDAIDGAVLECGESGSTLRFLLPVVSALGVGAKFMMEGRLPARPLSPLYELLCNNGVSLSEQGKNPLILSGRLSGKEFSIRADISSQFISGLLFAAAIMGGGIKINLLGKVESSAYIDMTIDTLSIFGVKVSTVDGGFEIPSGAKLTSPSSLEVEGDWSNAAFPLCMGVLGDSAVEVTGLNPDSRQGDRKIIDILRSFGAKIELCDGAYKAYGAANLKGINIDATDIPDLIPVISSVAAVAKGVTVISGAARLRLKESDRLSAITKTLSSLGANITEVDDGLIITGVSSLRGGAVDSFNDHRIAMSAAVAAAACSEAVEISGAECVAKSYPSFWEDIKYLGANPIKY